MKAIKIITILLLTNVCFTFAQNINWNSLPDDQLNLVYFNFGYDFGITTQLGYGHQLSTTRPIMLLSDFCIPMGKDLIDDYKFRAGAQMRILNRKSFSLSAKFFGIIRKQQTKMVSLNNFGSELSVIAGIYKSNWHLSAELGFDKSLATHSKHSELLKNEYAAIQDGWFVSSGGQFFYGIQGSKTVGQKMELTTRVGATDAQGNDENALLPFYFQMGITYKFLPNGNI